MMADPRIKTRRDIINLTVLDSLDKVGAETTWRNRLHMLRNIRDELMLKRNPSESETETLKEVVLMLAELKTISRRAEREGY